MSGEPVENSGGPVAKTLPGAARLRFRAWNGDMMSEPFHPWDLHDDGCSMITREGVSVHWAGYPYSWMQWTGLLDKTGREIYEGDFLSCPRQGLTLKIEWYHGGFGFYLKSVPYRVPVWVPIHELGWFRVVTTEGEVVGNIYEAQSARPSSGGSHPTPPPPDTTKGSP